MKRNVLFLIAGVLALACLTSCLHEVLDAPKAEGMQLTFEAVRENVPATKTQVGGDDATEVLWSVGDEISIFFGEGDAGGSRFTSTAEAPERTTRFTGYIETITGTLDADSDAMTIVGVYPFDTNTSLHGAVVSAVFPAKQRAEETSFSKNAFFSMGRADGLRIGFYNLCGGICFTVGREDLTKVTLTGNQDELVAGAFTARFDSEGLPVSTIAGKEKSIELTAPDGECFKAGTTYYLPLLPMVFENGFKLTFENENYRGSCLAKGRIEIRRSEFRRIMQADKDVIYEPTGVPAAVDLGVVCTRPDSSTYPLYWSSFNLGASSPDGYGQYYGWGETETKENYWWDSYRWVDASITGLTRYCPEDWAMIWSGSGEPDNKIVLDPEDDVASVKLGGNWRMPTSSEWMALIEQCTWIWTTLNGVPGYQVKSKTNDNSIFLPAAGMWMEDEFYSEGSGYWSSSLDLETEMFDTAMCLAFDASSVVCISDGADRCYGMSIRPVRE